MGYLECLTDVESCKVKLCDIRGPPYRNTGECRLVYHLCFSGSTRKDSPARVGVSGCTLF